MMIESRPNVSNPVETATRNIGIAVNEFFQNSVVSHQGTFYQVIDIDNQGHVFTIDYETYQNLYNKLMLFDPLFTNLLPKYPDKDDYADEFEYHEEIRKRLPIQVPHSVQCYITDPLSMFRCPNCDEFLSIKSARINSKRICPNCKHEVFQAPIRVLTKKLNDREALVGKRNPLVKISNTPCPKCSRGSKRVFRQLATLDHRRPFGSLRIYCRQHEPPNSPYAEKVFRKGFRISLPSQRLIVPVVITICNLRNPTPMEVEPLAGDFVETIRFYKKMSVIQIVLGYSYPDSGITQPLRVFNGRKFLTQGIEIVLKEDSYPRLYENLKNVYRDPAILAAFTDDLERLGDNFFTTEENEELEAYNQNQIRRWTLHSLAHSLMMMLPFRTGLEASKFGYSYDIHQNRVIIYDNEEGGIGGCQMLFSNKKTWQEYLEVIRDRIHACDCRARCPRCLVIAHCGEISNALNRHLLGPVFGIITDYE